MCGIIGYVGSRECKPLLLQGLERLEYRGYDSAGHRAPRGGRPRVRARGRPAREPEASARARTAPPRPPGSATRAGRRTAAVTEENAHPLAGCEPERLSIVLNGIVENYRELSESLAADGHTFTSETDAETVTHLVERHYEGDLVEAVRAAFAELEGHFAFVVIHRDHPGLLVGARHQVPLVVGLGEGEMFLASNAAAFLRETRTVQFPGDGEIVAITPEGARFLTRRRRPGRARDASSSTGTTRAPRRAATRRSCSRRSTSSPTPSPRRSATACATARSSSRGSACPTTSVKELRRIVLVACGTAYHACVVGRYVIEEWARVPVEFDIASEWIYRNPVINERDLVIGITQSGETRDTIEALKLAREQGARTVAITNMMGSQVTREVDSVLYTRAGLEMGVAASKTFTAQVALLYLVALKLAQIRETLPPGEIEFILDFVYKLPRKIQAFLDGDHPIEEIARRYHDAPFFLYLGRHIGLPVALEGALKLKEISYIPTEAYSAGEMKHGPIALLDEETPVVVVATNIHLYDKIVSNIQEVRARGAHVIAIATDGNEDIQHHADDVIYVPKTPAFLQVVLAILPLQLLAYRIARLRGLNVDQPRNLAKTTYAVESASRSASHFRRLSRATSRRPSRSSGARLASPSCEAGHQKSPKLSGPVWAPTDGADAVALDVEHAVDLPRRRARSSAADSSSRPAWPTAAAIGRSPASASRPSAAIASGIDEHCAIRAAVAPSKRPTVQAAEAGMRPPGLSRTTNAFCTAPPLREAARAASPAVPPAASASAAARTLSPTPKLTVRVSTT